MGPDVSFAYSPEYVVNCGFGKNKSVPSYLTSLKYSPRPYRRAGNLNVLAPGISKQRILGWVAFSKLAHANYCIVEEGLLKSMRPYISTAAMCRGLKKRGWY